MKAINGDLNPAMLILSFLLHALALLHTPLFSLSSSVDWCLGRVLNIVHNVDTSDTHISLGSVLLDPLSSTGAPARLYSFLSVRMTESNLLEGSPLFDTSREVRPPMSMVGNAGQAAPLALPAIGCKGRTACPYRCRQIGNEGYETRRDEARRDEQRGRGVNERVGPRWLKCKTIWYLLHLALRSRASLSCSRPFVAPPPSLSLLSTVCTYPIADHAAHILLCRHRPVQCNLCSPGVTMDALKIKSHIALHHIDSDPQAMVRKLAAQMNPTDKELGKP